MGLRPRAVTPRLPAGPCSGDGSRLPGYAEARGSGIASAKVVEPGPRGAPGGRGVGPAVARSIYAATIAGQLTLRPPRGPARPPATPPRNGTPVRPLPSCHPPAPRSRRHSPRPDPPAAPADPAAPPDATSSAAAARSHAGAPRSFTPAPGSGLSRTIRPFTAAGHFRRPVALSRTSMRPAKPDRQIPPALSPHLPMPNPPIRRAEPHAAGASAEDRYPMGCAAVRAARLRRRATPAECIRTSRRASATGWPSATVPTGNSAATSLRLAPTSRRRLSSPAKVPSTTSPVGDTKARNTGSCCARLLTQQRAPSEQGVVYSKAAEIGGRRTSPVRLKTPTGGGNRQGDHALKEDTEISPFTTGQ